jgi:uncharacterized protein YggE
LEDSVKRLALAVVLLAVPSLPAFAQAPQPGPPQGPPVVVTQGEGVVKHSPDRMWVSISAESRARNPRDAQRANSEAMAAVLAKLKSAGLQGDAIKTTAYDLQPEFDYVNGRQSLRGYVARNSVEVRLDDLARAGEILDVAVGSGATSVSGVRFDIKDRERAEREALRLAVADARSRADAAASGAGASVASVLRIEEQRALMPPPRPLMEMTARAASGDAASPPIAPGELEIRATVTLTAVIR